MKLSKLFAAGLALALVAGLTSCGGSDHETIGENYDYIPVRESSNSHWSFYGPDGKIKYPEEFKERPSVVYNGYFSVNENSGYTLYKADDKPVAIAEGLNYVGVMSDGLVPVTRKLERISVLDGDGSTVFTIMPVKGHEIKAALPKYHNGYLMVRNDEDQIGFINTSGEVAVEPKYVWATDFSGGKAIVVKDFSDEKKYSVIDTKGEKLFSFPANVKNVNGGFSYGMIYTTDVNDHVVFYDDNGELKHKCPAKVKSVDAFNKDYIIFRDDDYKVGVINFDDEVVVRPKFNSIQIVDGDKFLANDGDKYLLLDSEGNEIRRFEDYRDVVWFGQYNYIASEKNTKLFLDSEGKPVKNAEFERVYLDLDFSRVLSDYFDMGSVVEAAVSLVGDNGVGNYTFGQSPSSIFSNIRDCTGRSNKTLPGLEKSGRYYSLSVTGYFSKRMADYSYGYGYGYTYQRNDYWVSGSTLAEAVIEVSVYKDWGIAGGTLVAKALKAKGFTDVSNTVDDYNYHFVMKKGAETAKVEGSVSGSGFTITLSRSAEAVSAAEAENIAAADTLSGDTAVVVK